jgi:hypothetical protein
MAELPSCRVEGKVTSAVEGGDGRSVEMGFSVISTSTVGFDIYRILFGLLSIPDDLVTPILFLFFPVIFCLLMNIFSEVFFRTLYYERQALSWRYSDFKSE